MDKTLKILQIILLLQIQVLALQLIKIQMTNHTENTLKTLTSAKVIFLNHFNQSIIYIKNAIFLRFFWITKQWLQFDFYKLVNINTKIVIQTI